jgi:FAD/FMN-containing dehydrogenase
MVSAHVVTADGQFRRASATENPDLFWGVRGGGGNFGIVTSFEFQLHPMQRQVLAGAIVYPISKAKDALRVFAEYGPQVPDELDLGFVMAIDRGGKPGVVMFPVCYSGPVNAADKVFAPLRKLGTPLSDEIKAMDYVAVQRSGDISDPRAQGQYLKSGFVNRIPNDLINAIVDGFAGHPDRGTALFFQQGGGAIARVPGANTAFAQRDSQANMLCAVDWKFGDDPAPHIKWIKDYWAPLDRFTTGVYVNDVGDRSASEVVANYRRNHDRLVAAKNKYDPKNLFRLNANVKPTGAKT